VQAARDEGRVLWVTHLHATAAPLEAPLTVPPRLAVVMGSERYGVSDTMRHAADLVRQVEDGQGCRQAVVDARVVTQNLPERGADVCRWYTCPCTALWSR
jgi:hypothetical protein